MIAIWMIAALDVKVCRNNSHAPSVAAAAAVAAAAVAAAASELGRDPPSGSGGPFAGLELVPDATPALGEVAG